MKPRSETEKLPSQSRNTNSEIVSQRRSQLLHWLSLHFQFLLQKTESISTNSSRLNKSIWNNQDNYYQHQKCNEKGLFQWGCVWCYISVTVGTSCYFLVMWGTLLLAFYLSRSFFFHISKYIYNVTIFFFNWKKLSCAWDCYFRNDEDVLWVRSHRLSTRSKLRTG